MDKKINVELKRSPPPSNPMAKGHLDPIFGDIWIKDTEGMIDGQKDLAGRYCDKLWTWFEVDMWGKCWMCCPSWLPYSIGNILEDDIKEMWNGPKAQALRQQVFDGTWQYCQHNFCPLIASDKLPSLKAAKANARSDIDRSLAHTNFNYISDHGEELSIIANELPTRINFSNDESCNLKCPSCRPDKILLTEGKLYDTRKLINDKTVEAFLTEPTDRYFSIHVTGSGDPFASKIYRDMLYNLDGSKFPNLDINLQTNGVMFTPKMWNKLHKIHNQLRACRISFDAGTKDTYENKTRLGGNWDLLLRNCDFLNDRQNDYNKFYIHYDFVVQATNYKEMPTYIDLILNRYNNAVTINFSLVTDWGTWSPEDYKNQCIWKDSHPEHNDFLNVLKHELFNHEKVELGSMKPYHGQ